ncbi:uncharacterized protein SPAPADRAFT_68179 [Spathaspora passalidarum NRRL Y-27907]|uniref:Uncharacterized protein n=1 Tax=Spathaspora passalidarum (strain NRRL Y-27907 / 11-Y1) TaxID=619300 RepID=G3ATJ3_SPAPN|nr:uncharacterized protein SPAPADRAFT_68179 [Spathaspora passalidarum NRRL Y-27907]EGW30956.1 hypothetical protein SPAPADRAFT_68179 [Spathaspora passalidarum NRRL Y-27907]
MGTPDPSEELASSNAMVKPEASTPRNRTPDLTTSIENGSSLSTSSTNKTGLQTPETSPRFQVPGDVLKNLTPSRSMKSPEKQQQAIKKRQAHLDSIRHRLKRKSLELSNRLQILQFKRQEETRRRINRINKDLHEKKQRRSKYLDLIRERAGKFYLRNVSILFKPTITPIKKYKQDVVEAPILVDTGFITDIQRKCRLILFRKYIATLEESKFLDEFESYSFNKIVEILNTNSTIKTSMNFILKYLNVPRLFGAQYKSFFYCFILVGDFNDCMEFEKHPGFNANNSLYESELYFYNSIWLLVYKFTKLLINEFKLVVRNRKLHDNFISLWYDYNFIFKIFKWNHYRNICDILSDSLAIVDQQITVSESNEGKLQLMQQKSKLAQELSLLNSYNIEELAKFNETVEVVQFKKSFSNIVAEFYAKPTHHVLIQNKTRVIQFSTFKFYVPTCEILKTSEWRKFWFDKFRRQEDNREFPETIRSGYIKNLIERNVDEFIHVDDIVSRKVTDDVEFRLPQIYNDLREYYIEFMKAKNDIDLDYIDLDTNDNYYLKLMEELIRHYDYDNSILLDLTAKIYQNGIISKRVIQELETYVCNLWINKSKFTEFAKVQQFENIYTLINTVNFSKLRFNIFTSSPNLLFQNFYQMILKYNQPMLDLSEDTQRRILHSAFKNSVSRVLISADKENSRQFFTRLFYKIIVYEDNLQPDELNGLFCENFTKFHTRILQLIDATVFRILYSNYIYPSDRSRARLTKVEVQTLVTRLQNTKDVASVLQAANIADFGFFKYYTKSHETFKTLLQGKVFNMLQSGKSKEAYIIIEGNFPDFNGEVLELANDVWKMTFFVYKLYNPILNWIYIDLGMS